MLKVEKIVVNIRYMTVNSYILHADGENAVVIDPSAGYEQITSRLKELGKQCRAVLLTHGHFDHIIDTAKFRADGAKVYAHPLCAPKLKDKNLNLSRRLWLGGIAPSETDTLIKAGDILEFEGFRVRVMETPGHSADSCCFICEGYIFTGDTLFYGDYGRTDFYDSCHADLIRSIKRLFALPGDYIIHPGHEDSSTLDAERRHNLINNEF
jgi:hydroxyacylglutathione hydrolase